MSGERGSDLHAERADHYKPEKSAGKSMIKNVVTVFFGLAVIGGVFSGAGYWFYNQGQPIQNDGNLPILIPDPSPIKIRPEDPGGMEVPHRKATVYDQLSDVDPDVNVTLQELPDMPRAPDVTSASPMSESKQLVMEKDAIQSSDASTTIAESEMDADPASSPKDQTEAMVKAPKINEPDLSNAEKAVVAAKNRTRETAAGKVVEEGTSVPAPVVPNETTAVLQNDYRVQLASVREESGATSEWHRLSSNNKDLLDKLKMFVQRIEIEGKGIFYRLQAGPLADLAVAEKLCADLKKRSVECLIVRP